MVNAASSLNLDAADPKPVVVTERTAPVAWVTLSRPEMANALDLRTIEGLHEALTECERSDSTRAIVVTGAGRNFCGGADLNELLAGGSAGVRTLLDLLRRLLARLETSRLITVAAVHGAARAGGLELALACDVILAARSATFGDAHVLNGLLPGGGSTARLPRAVGWQRAKWLILSGASIDASTALRWGLAFDVVEDSELKHASQQIARSMIGADSDVLRSVKRLLSKVSEQPLSTSLEAEISTLQAHYHSAAFQSGVAGFLRRHKASS